MSFRSLPAAFAVAASLAVLGGVAGDARAASPSPALRAALQRDLGLAGPQLDRYLTLERDAASRQQRARQRFGPRFGGAWLARDAAGDFRLKIAATGAAPGARLADLDADLVPATYPLWRLEAGLARLRQPIAAPRLGAGHRPDPAIHAWYVDVPANRIVVETDRGARARDLAAAFVAAAGLEPAMVRIVAVDGRPSTSGLAQGALYGGDGYGSEITGCSVGFSARWSNAVGFVTAGHCGRGGMAAYGPKGSRIGTFVSSSFPGNDYASVQIGDPLRWDPVALIRGYGAGDLRVMGNMETPIGGAVCRSGMASGYQCGVVRAREVDINYPEGLVTGLTRSSACSEPGDSGGPFFSPGGEAQGIASGNNALDGHACNTILPSTYYQPIVPALAGLGMTLITARSCGRMNPGDVLTPGSAITSCDGRFQLTQQVDGNLVLYKFTDTGRRPLWSNSQFGADFITVLQLDGNLVTYDAAMRPLWHIERTGPFGSTLFLQDDGNLVLYTPQGAAAWDAGTWRN